MFFHFLGPENLKNGDNSKLPKIELLGFPCSRRLPSSTSRLKKKKKWEVFSNFFVYVFLVMFCLDLHFVVISFLNLTLEGVESNPGPTRFSLSSDYSDSVGSNSSTGLRNFTIKKSIQYKHLITKVISNI